MASPRLAKSILVIWVSIFLAVNDLFQFKPLLRAKTISQQTPSDSKKLQAPASVDSELTPEQKIAVLKKEELELAEGLMSDFPNSAYSIMLMGNVLERHGDAVEAVKYMRKVLELDPNRPDVYKSIG